MKLSRRDFIAYGIVAVLAVVGLFWQNAGTSDGGDTSPPPVESPAVGDDTAQVVLDAGSITLRADQVSDLPTIGLGELPTEAIDTLELIETDGPYPFDRDGITFQNREGLLPDRDGDHYEEFTVITPGLDHRGARRIVAGDDGERYYTDDHYDSFSEVTP